MEKWKRCSKCKNIKSINEFYKKKKNEEERVSECKTCQKEYRIKNKEKIKNRYKKYYQKNKEKIKKRCKNYYELNKEELLKKSFEYKMKNKEKIDEWNRNYSKEKYEERKEYMKEYRIKNKEKINKQKNEWKKNKLKNDINYRVKNNVSKSIRESLNGRKNGRKVEKILGYKIEEIKKALEEKFEDWMGWDNYGNTCGKSKTWEIDHIIPISVYNFFDKNDIKKCWDLRNLRPLESKENASKSNFIDMELIKEHDIEHLLPEIMLVEDFLDSEI